MFMGSFFGAGEVSGMTQLLEWGLIETPIFLTNTLSVGAVSDAAVKWMIDRYPGIGDEHDVIIPLVGECDDSWLNDIAGRHVKEEHVLEALRFGGKHSTPWTPESTHDFMHAKTSVIDDVVFIGSYNLSRSGEENAENVIEIEDAALADRVAAWIDGVRARYPDVPSPSKRP